MDRRQLESAGANYPHMHMHMLGLYGVPAGLLWFLIGLFNLAKPSAEFWILGGGALLCLAAWAGVSLYYQRNFGRVTPARSGQVRYSRAAGAGCAVFVAANVLGIAVLGRHQPVSVMAAGWALGMLVFYAAIAGLRAHHIVIWGSLLVAGLLPIWGGVDVDAVACLAIGAATIASGLFDHRILVRIFRSYKDLNLEDSNAGT